MKCKYQITNVTKKQKKIPNTNPIHNEVKSKHKSGKIDSTTPEQLLPQKSYLDTGNSKTMLG